MTPVVKVHPFIMGSLAAIGIFAAGFFTNAFAGEPALIDRQWTMPARFEGQGAFTLGCALWDVPEKTEGELGDSFYVGVDDTFGLVAIMDSPTGPTMVTGKKCAISVDWSAFPQEQRPAPKESY